MARIRAVPVRLIALALFMLPVAASAAGNALTVYGGYRDGGSFTEENSDECVEIKGAGAVSLALDFPYDNSRQYQIFLSHQRTELSLDGTPIAGGPELDMNITYLHVGGTYFFTGPVGKGPYVVGGLGATFFDPSAGYDSELRGSGNLGFGYQLPIGETLALRFEARGYATLVNSSGGFFCSGGCVVSISGDTITQGELMLGVSGRF